MEYKFTKANFQKEVLESDVPVLVDMFATWCGPCRSMAPVVEALAEKFEGKAKVGKLDIDEDGDIAMEYSVMSVPTFLIFKDGKVVDKVIGAVDQSELEEKLK